MLTICTLVNVKRIFALGTFDLRSYSITICVPQRVNRTKVPQYHYDPGSQYNSFSLLLENFFYATFRFGEYPVGPSTFLTENLGTNLLKSNASSEFLMNDLGGQFSFSLDDYEIETGDKFDLWKFFDFVIPDCASFIRVRILDNSKGRIHQSE